MTTFGTSSYLKIISLRPAPQRTEITNRLLPSDDAYDFHRSLRRLIRRLAINAEPLEQVLASAHEISQMPERNSAIEGLRALSNWLRENPSTVGEFKTKTISSPNAIFKVKFSPDFVLTINGTPVVVHVWNTKNPPLDTRMMFGAMSLFSELYRDDLSTSADLAILSLRNSQLYRLSQVADHSATGFATIQRLERIFTEIESELSPYHPSQDDHPRHSPPAE